MLQDLGVGNSVLPPGLQQALKGSGDGIRLVTALGSLADNPDTIK